MRKMRQRDQTHPNPASLPELIEAMCAKHPANSKYPIGRHSHVLIRETFIKCLLHDFAYVHLFLKNRLHSLTINSIL